MKLEFGPQQELAETNAVQLQGNEPGLALYYNMDEGVACGNNSGIYSLDDSSSTNLNGVLKGFAKDGSQGCISNFTNGSPALNSSLTVVNDYTNTSDASSTYPLGTTVINWTATDASGNKTTNTQTIIVTDNTAPTVITQNITVGLDANGNTSITPQMIDNTSFDNCSIASYSLSKDNFDCTNVGTNIVTLTIVDVHGNMASKKAIVTVSDNILPSAIAKDITVQLDVNGVVSIVPSDIDNGSNDNCTFTTSLDTTTFNCANVGITNTVTLIVRDASGNTNSTTATVTVLDTVPAEVITQNFNAYLDENGNTSISVVDINNGSNDACGIATLVLDITSFSCANLGQNTVTLTVTDVNGNISSNTAIVNVIDNIAPIVGTQNISVELDANGNASINPEDVLILSENDVKRGEICIVSDAGEYAMSLKDYNENDDDDHKKSEKDKDHKAKKGKDKDYKDEDSEDDDDDDDENGHFLFNQNQGSIIKNLDGTAVITGTLVNSKDANDQWMVTLNLQNPKNWTDWSSTDKKYKESKKTTGYSYKDWTYYEMAAGSKLTGVGSNAGLETLLSQKYEKYGIQIGDKANLENGNYGLSGEFYYTTKNGEKEKGEFNFDISNCGLLPVPEGTIITSDNCSLNNYSLNTSTFSCDNLGENTVQVSVTDQSGNTTTQNVIVNVLGDQPIVTIPDFTSVDGQKANTFFLGYQEHVELKPEVTGGKGFIYEWTDTAGNVISREQSPEVSPTITTTYHVTVTNSNGCSDSASIEVCVIDARYKDKYGRFNGKVVICHHANHNEHSSSDDDDDDDKKSSKKNHKSRTIVINVSKRAVKGHLKHGDRLGSCEATCKTTEDPIIEPIISLIDIYPNPSIGSFKINLENFEGSSVYVTLHDFYGRTIQYKKVKLKHGKGKLKMGKRNLRLGTYIVKVVANGIVYTKKVIIEKDH